VDYANYNTAKLRDVDDSYYFGVHCRSCLRSARLSLSRLRGLLCDDFPVVNVRTRLKGSTCGSKELTVTFLAPHQAVGNLADLFTKPAQ
jgi:hypothetical protein